MKLMRYGAKGSEKPALVDSSGQVRNLSGILTDINATTLSKQGLTQLAALDISSLPIVTQPDRVAPPHTDIGKFICVGLNYVDHAAESGMAPPAEPVLFMKATSAVIGLHRRIE